MTRSCQSDVEPAAALTGPAQVHVGLGSNQADPVRQISAAVHRLAQWPGVTGLRASRLYRTPPWGQCNQPDFINAVAELRYTGTAMALLNGLLAIEREAGRVRAGARWGPRVLDLDLLLFGTVCIDLPGLSVPHPHLGDRAFVLLPLAELAPDRILPDGRNIGQLARAIDAGGIAKLDCRS